LSPFPRALIWIFCYEFIFRYYLLDFNKVIILSASYEPYPLFDFNYTMRVSLPMMTSSIYWRLKRLFSFFVMIKTYCFRKNGKCQIDAERSFLACDTLPKLNVDAGFIFGWIWRGVHTYFTIYELGDVIISDFTLNL
jgi:hypothetical protein